MACPVKRVRADGDEKNRSALINRRHYKFVLNCTIARYFFTRDFRVKQQFYGEVKSRNTKNTKNRANTAFRRAAQSLARSQSASGAFYRRIRTKHGAPVAVTATAHRLARIVYFMLLRREPYQAIGADYYYKQHQERSIRNLKRRAAQLGLRLEPIPSDERVS